MATIEILQNNWFIIVFIGGVIASWARYELKINTLEGLVESNHNDSRAEIEKLKISLSAQEKTMDSFKEGIGKNIQEIQTTMKFILEAINDIKKK